MKVVGETSETCKMKLKNKLPFIFRFGDVTMAITSCIASHMEVLLPL